MRTKRLSFITDPAQRETENLQWLIPSKAFKKHKQPITATQNMQLAKTTMRGKPHSNIARASCTHPHKVIDADYAEASKQSDFAQHNQLENVRMC